MLNVDVIAKTSLAPDKAISTYMMIGKNEQGRIVAEEINKQLPGQGVIDEDVEKIKFIGDAK